MIPVKEGDFIQRCGCYKRFCSRGEIGLNAKCNKEKWGFMRRVRSVDGKLLRGNVRGERDLAKLIYWGILVAGRPGWSDITVGGDDGR